MVHSRESRKKVSQSSCPIPLRGRWRHLTQQFSNHEERARQGRYLRLPAWRGPPGRNTAIRLQPDCARAYVGRSMVAMEAGADWAEVRRRLSQVGLLAGVPAAACSTNETCLCPLGFAPCVHEESVKLCRVFPPFLLWHHHRRAQEQP